jgi:hypothetical protein
MRWLRRSHEASSQQEQIAAAEPLTPARVSGTTGKDGRVVQEPSETIVEGVSMVRDFVIEWGPLAVGDARLVGATTVVLNADVHTASDGVETVPQAIALRIENDAGSWSGQGTSISHGRGAMRPEEALNLDTIVLTGAGAYEGLLAYLVIDGTRDPARVDGAIVAGTMPPSPEVPPA